MFVYSTDDNEQQNQRQLVIESLQSLWGSFPDHLYIVLERCFACLIHHIDHVRHIACLTPSLAQSSFFQLDLESLKSFCKLGYPWDHQFDEVPVTGIPPHVFILNKMKAIENAQERSSTRIIDVLTMALHNELEDHQMGGQINMTHLRELMEPMQNEITLISQRQLQGTFHNSHGNEDEYHEDLQVQNEDEHQEAGEEVEQTGSCRIRIYTHNDGRFFSGRFPQDGHYLLVHVLRLGRNGVVHHTIKICPSLHYAVLQTMTLTICPVERCIFQSYVL